MLPGLDACCGDSRLDGWPGRVDCRKAWATRNEESQKSQSVCRRSLTHVLVVSLTNGTGLVQIGIEGPLANVLPTELI